MKTRSHVVLYVGYTKTYKGVKFHYGYQFVSYKNKMRFRGLEVWVPKASTSTIFMYPGHETNRAYDRWRTNDELKASQLPPDLSKLKKRKDIQIPQEVIEAVRKKVSMEVDTEFAKS